MQNLSNTFICPAHKQTHTHRLLKSFFYSHWLLGIYLHLVSSKDFPSCSNNIWLSALPARVTKEISPAHLKLVTSYSHKHKLCGPQQFWSVILSNYFYSFCRESRSQCSSRQDFFFFLKKHNHITNFYSCWKEWSYQQINWGTQADSSEFCFQSCGKVTFFFSWTSLTCIPGKPLGTQRNSLRVWWCLF